MYMCQVVVLGVLLVPVSGCICNDVEVLNGIPKEVVKKAVEEDVSKNRKQGASEEFPRF